MTRISATIRPVELCDQMLLAEHREIVRIPNMIKSGKAKVRLDKIPDNFRLGTGHVTFFYNKLYYLYKRYISLYRECLRRGFNVKDYSNAFLFLPDTLLNDWKPDKNIVRPQLVDRINNRLSNMSSIRFLGENITLEKAMLK